MHPIQVAEYAIAQCIQHEQAFNRWVHNVFKKRDRIIFSVKWNSVQYLQRVHKFGVKLPKVVKKAIAINETNGNIYWQDAITKEMENMKVAFHMLPNGKKACSGYQYINSHILLDIKTVDFREKACLWQEAM